MRPTWVHNIAGGQDRKGVHSYEFKHRPCWRIAICNSVLELARSFSFFYGGSTSNVSSWLYDRVLILVVFLLSTSL